MQKEIMLITFVMLATLSASIITPSYSEYLSPKKQMNSGVLSLDVICNDKVLVIRPSGDGVSCLTSYTAEKLFDRGWIVVSNILDNDNIYKISLKNLVNSVYLFENRTVIITGNILKQDIVVPMVMCNNIPQRPTEIISGYKTDRNSPYVMNDGIGNSIGVRLSMLEKNYAGISFDNLGEMITVTGIIKNTTFAPYFCDNDTLQNSAYVDILTIQK